MFCTVFNAVVYRAYAIRTYNFRNTKFGYFFRNTPKTIFHVIRLCQLICLSTIYRATNCTAVGAYGIRPGLRGFRDVAAMVCGTVNAVVYRAYAIRPTISAKPNSAISSETRRKPYFTLYGFANLFAYPHYTEPKKSASFMYVKIQKPTDLHNLLSFPTIAHAFQNQRT